MKLGKAGILGILLTVILVGGCALSGDKMKVLDANDEVQLYPLPYDLVYLRTLEALELVPDWELEETEKEKGIIRMRNANFSRFDDSDLRAITILIKRMGARETSVQLAAESQYVAGGDALLKGISQYLQREIENTPVG